MRKFKKKIIEEDLIIESNIENTEEKEDIETEHSFYISDEKFSISWDQPTNRCNRTHLSQTLEIKTENEMYKNELIRLRALLESGLGGGLRVMMKKREQMS